MPAKYTAVYPCTVLYCTWIVVFLSSWFHSVHMSALCEACLNTANYVLLLLPLYREWNWWLVIDTRCAIYCTDGLSLCRTNETLYRYSVHAISTTMEHWTFLDRLGLIHGGTSCVHIPGCPVDQAKRINKLWYEQVIMTIYNMLTVLHTAIHNISELIMYSS